MSEDNGGSFEKCLKCGTLLVTKNSGFCSECIQKMFGNSVQPIFFCKKCKSSHELNAIQMSIALREAKVSAMPKNGLIILISDSCQTCFIEGDSDEARFSLLKPIVAT